MAHRMTLGTGRFFFFSSSLFSLLITASGVFHLSVDCCGWSDELLPTLSEPSGCPMPV